MNDVRSPEQIECEINELRAQISDTLDAVQQKLSPGQLLDQALSYAKDGGAVASNIGRGMRDNPVPAALCGLSLGWLWYAGKRSEHGAERRHQSTDDERIRDARDSLDRALRDLRDAGSATADYTRNNPLTTATMAVAAGAVVGGLLFRRRR